MTGAKRMKDPLPKFGGRPIHPLVLVVVSLAALLGGILGWVYGSGSGGYDEVDRLGSIKCLGCLGLDPVVPGFSGFWDDYPEDHVDAGESVVHPAIVGRELGKDDIDLLVLFFWTQGCVPCAEQWEEMVDKDIAIGPEDGGREGALYRNVRLISVDAANDPDGLYMTYRPTGKETGVPMTTFLFYADSGSDVMWYSHYGKMDIGPLQGMMEQILYHEISGVH